MGVKEEMQAKLAEALTVLKNENWPDAAKADIYRMLCQFAFLLIGNVHAGAISSLEDAQKFINVQLKKNMELCQDEIAKKRRSNLKVISNDEEPDETVH